MADYRTWISSMVRRATENWLRHANREAWCAARPRNWLRYVNRGRHAATGRVSVKGRRSRAGLRMWSPTHY